MDVPTNHANIANGYDVGRMARSGFSQRRKDAKTQREFGARRVISRRRRDTEIKAADSEKSSAAW